MVRATIVILCLALGAVFVACGDDDSSAPPPADVAATWKGSVALEDGSQQADLCMLLTQKDRDFSGTVGNGGPAVAGKATDAGVSLVVQAPASGETPVGAAALLAGAVLSGDLEDDTLTGVWVSALGKGTWTMARTSETACP